MTLPQKTSFSIKIDALPSPLFLRPTLVTGREIRLRILKLLGYFCRQPILRSAISVITSHHLLFLLFLLLLFVFPLFIPLLCPPHAFLFPFDSCPFLLLCLLFLLLRLLPSSLRSIPLPLVCRHGGDVASYVCYCY